KAAGLARLERSALLGLEERTNIDARVIARSRDWSQVRPEWGLAGNAAFIAAPRALTRGIDFAGRAFLHSYEHERDDNDRVL
ncbi:putative inorganic carbon transporter subunit DabA, partial [Enterococcus faecalis]|uniref:putative inorganic carbon transporter subunit DabA n=1 Tax=Enterococcus faecalis TaxID=1351 RepID=UPI003D6A6E05